MKTKILLTIATVVSLSFAGTVFAAGTVKDFTDSGADTLGTPAVSVKPSKGVTVKYRPDAAGLTYSIAASHSSGTKSFGSSSGDTKIYMIEGIGTAPPNEPAANSSADFAGWTAM